MSVILSTTIIAVSVIAAATVGLCLHQLDGTEWLAVVGGFAGGIGTLHVAAAGAKGSGGQ